MKRLVADTGPLLHLHQAGATHLLPLIGQVSIPSIVLAELRHHASNLWPTQLPDWLSLTPLPAEAARRAVAWQQAGLLHGGEAESLALACEIGPDWFLTDDAAARLLAESLGVETHGSLGVVLWAAAARLIGKGEADSVLNGLENSSLWLSATVRAQARAALAQIYLPTQQ